MLKVKNSKGQWINIEEARLHQKLDKMMVSGAMHQLVADVIPIIKLPKLTKEQTDKFIEAWTKVSKESNIILIDDVE